jgi:large subunit ribosomal protein L25
MERVVNHGERLVKLDIEGKERQAMIKEVQYEPVSRLIAHVDFQEISATETITVTVPIRARGTPAGANEGGILDMVMHEIEVEARAADFPEEIRLDVTALNIGDSIRAGQIPLPPGLKLVTDERATVAAVEHPRSEEDAETQVAAAEGGAEPEVLTGKKEEEAAGEAAPAAEEKKPAKPAEPDAKSE